MKLLARTMIALCLMAFVAGEELNRESRVVSVSVRQVDPASCEYDGGTVAATEHSDNPGVYAVRCGDGVVLTGWNR